MELQALVKLWILVFAYCGLHVGGTDGIVLSSSVESENGHVTVCPDTTISFTCSDAVVFGMVWYALPLLNEDSSPALGSDTDIGDPHMVEGVFAITLVSRELMMGDFRGNYTSTLDVVVNDRIQNETNVTCYTLSSVASLLIFKQGLFYCIVGCKIFWGYSHSMVKLTELTSECVPAGVQFLYSFIFWAHKILNLLHNYYREILYF
ncbi:hypothetical protein GBAR_LOCUS12645 [Geodia barretti]|uniref:Uncharacterized protein n=1 Tax=Geodia barretti TaxID=519541 RepID=A0AA35WPA6_GEOBA|nr:hypothetical protein GBAR_LOCUS12645 [Geodia barretti]